MNFFAKFYLYRNCYGPESRSSSCLVKNISSVDIRGQCKEIRELFNRFFLGNLSRLSDFEDLTAFVGKNDIGKSTILEALDIFLLLDGD